MMHPTFSNQRPTRAGYYLCWRVDYQNKPEFVSIEHLDKKLWYRGHISSFPLSRLERTALFSERINLHDKPQSD